MEIVRKSLGKAREFIFLSNLQACQVGDCEGICCIIWLWYLRKLEYHLESLLHLWLFGKAISCNTCLHLKGGKLYKWNSLLCERMQDNSTSMCDINTIGDISKEEEPFDTAYGRSIGIYEVLQIRSNLHKSFWKTESSLCSHDAILNNMDVLPCFLNKCKSRNGSSRINTKYHHTCIIWKIWICSREVVGEYLSYSLHLHIELWIRVAFWQIPPSLWVSGIQ